MPISEARIATDRAARYLAQLCDHLGHLEHGGLTGHTHRDGHGGPPVVRVVERTDDRAEIEFDWGRCELAASPDTLTVRVQADDTGAVTAGEELIGRRIETIGHRDHLRVTWQPTGSG